ncbi:MAG: helix-turn-helix domain-containing protein [Acetobacteraceae bacterium]
MPRGEGIPINRALVTWARERAGLTLEEVAQKFRNIAAWEDGSALPTYPQLESMADEFKLPIAVFFFPEPPQTPPIRESFRTLPDTEFDRMPKAIRFLLQKAKALQINLGELTQGRNPAPRFIVNDLNFRSSVTPDAMAVQVRKYLGVSLDAQFAWRDDDAALKAWRKVLQEVGIFVFKDAFRTEGFFGFSLYDDTFPLIYVNNSATKTRQIFTLFHELAHILFHTSGIDTQADDYILALSERPQRIEVLCNRFAAQFLVPDNAFAQAMVGRARDEAAAERLAAMFHVSRETIYRKFLDRRWITQRAYEGAVAGWNAQRQPGGGGGDFYNTKIAYLGREYIGLALRQYHQNRIDDEQLAEYLDTKPKNIGTLEEYFTAGS